VSKGERRIVTQSLKGEGNSYYFHGSCLHAEVRSASLREAASAKAGHAGVDDKLIMNNLFSH